MAHVKKKKNLKKGKDAVCGMIWVSETFCGPAEHTALECLGKCGWGRWKCMRSPSSITLLLVYLTKMC